LLLGAGAAGAAEAQFVDRLSCPGRNVTPVFERQGNGLTAPAWIDTP
jgi:hypothetical protein